MRRNRSTGLPSESRRVHQRRPAAPQHKQGSNPPFPTRSGAPAWDPIIICGGSEFQILDRPETPVENPTDRRRPLRSSRRKVK
jgi:hypothetical protein